MLRGRAVDTPDRRVVRELSGDIPVDAEPGMIDKAVDPSARRVDWELLVVTVLSPDPVLSILGPSEGSVVW